MTSTRVILVQLAEEAGACTITNGGETEPCSIAFDVDALLIFAGFIAHAERYACATLSPNGLGVLASDGPVAVWEKYSAAITARGVV